MKERGLTYFLLSSIFLYNFISQVNVVGLLYSLKIVFPVSYFEKVIAIRQVKGMGDGGRNCNA